MTVEGICESFKQSFNLRTSSGSFFYIGRFASGEASLEERHICGNPTPPAMAGIGDGVYHYGSVANRSCVFQWFLFLKFIMKKVAGSKPKELVKASYAGKLWAYCCSNSLVQKPDQFKQQLRLVSVEDSWLLSDISL